MKTLKVIHAPYFANNPYQSLWAQSVRHYNIHTSFINDFKGLFPLSRNITGQSCNYFHIHWLQKFMKTRDSYRFALSAPFFLIDLFFLRIKGIKIIWTLHNHDFHDSKVNKWLFLVFKKALLSLVHKVVVLNSFDKNYLMNSYGVKESKIHHIMHGNYKGIYKLNKVSWIEDIKARKGNKLTFLFFGMIRPYKGIDFLIDNWERFQDGKKDVHLIIAGKFRDEKFRAIINERVGKLNSVDLVDRFIEDNEIKALFSLTDFTVLPFKKVNNSGSLILSLTFNTLVIAPLFPTVKEYLRDALDFCYNFDDPNGLLNSLEMAYAKRAEFDLNVINKRNNELDWSNLSKGIKLLYK